MDSAMSPADMRAVLDGSYGGEGMGFGGSWFAWIILFALLGGNGFGFGGNNRAATVDEVAAGFSNSAVLNKLNELTVGQANISQNLGNSICQIGYQALEHTSALSTQMANCCCDLKTAIHAEGEATRNMIQQNKIESLQQQINALQLNSALCGIPRTSPYGYGIYAYPTCGTGCGCNGAF